MSDTTDTTNTDQTQNFSLFAALRKNPTHKGEFDGGDVQRLVGQLDDIITQVEDEGVTVRGFYDASGLRADADIMLWLQGEAPENLQWALRELRRSDLFRSLLPTWNAMGLHLDAAADAEPKQWLAVHPLVMSSDWHMLPESERHLDEDAMSALTLGDYEWLLPIEADELADLMRDPRVTDARPHVVQDVPVYTGRLIETVEIVEVLQ